MRWIKTIAVVLIGASCSAHSKPQQPSAESECLSYPNKDIRPAVSKSVENAHIVVSADGNVVGLSDTENRLIIWNLREGQHPVLYPGHGSIKAITKYGGAYLVGVLGQLIRTDIDTGASRITADGP